MLAVLMASDVETADYRVFLDESGNTGDVARSFARSFGGQRAFCLAAVGGERVSEFFASMQARHGLQGEAKTRARRNAAFAEEIVAAVASGLDVFVELVDKRFYLACNMVSFVLRSSVFDPVTQAEQANAFADVLSASLDDDAISRYCKLALNPDAEALQRFRSATDDCLRRAILRCSIMEELKHRTLRAVESSLSAALHERREEPASFVPPSDQAASGKELPLLPHTTSLMNLVSRINRQVPAGRSVRIVHDEQLQYQFALEKALADVGRHGARVNAVSRRGERQDWDLRGRCVLSFEDSSAEGGIQLADIVAGYCRSRFEDVLLGRVSATRTRALGRLLALTRQGGPSGSTSSAHHRTATVSGAAQQNRDVTPRCPSPDLSLLPSFRPRSCLPL